LAREPERRGDAAAFARTLASVRRRECAVGVLDLAVWVSEALDDRAAAQPVAGAALETLGMDE
jgi:hypothetical protein